MTEEEIKIVAEVLAKIGGNWYPERAGSAPRTVSNRHREVARVIIGAVERSREVSQSTLEESSDPEPSLELSGDEFRIGEVVLYRPPGDKRTVACRIKDLEFGRAYVVPEHREIGWVSTHSLLQLTPPRDNGSWSSRPPSPARSASGTDAPQAPATDILKVKSGRSQEASAGVKYYFSSSGEWIAFRRSETDRYLFDRKGNWIGWFPWGEKEIVDIEGQYLGTVLYGDRIYRKGSPAPEKRDAGFVMDPGPAAYVGYPGFATESPPPRGFKDVDMTKVPTGKRPWLKGSDPTAAEPSTFEIWMSKIGLGGLARAIKAMIRPT